MGSHLSPGSGAGGGADDPRPGPVVVVAARELAHRAAAAIRDLLAEAVAARGTAHLALAGGSTPRPVYARLAGLGDLPWTQLRIYFGDERAVPPDDPASNFQMAHETLLRHVPIPRRHVRRMEAEREDLEAAAAAYARLLPERLDLVLLGIGEDGHVASLFPGSPALEEHERRVLAVEGPTPPTQRLTLAPGSIRGARTTLVIAAGRAKAPAVARALAGPYDPRTCPAQLAREGRWILDREAAALLRTPGRSHEW